MLLNRTPRYGNDDDYADDVLRAIFEVYFQAIDGRPVHTIFLLLAPPDDPEAHLKVLRWISSLARNPDFRKFVVTAKDAKETRELLHVMSGPKA